jgi:hypothetical protein
MAWANKTKYFVAAACVVLIVSVLAFARAIIDRASYSSRSATRMKIQTVLESARQAESDLEAERGRRSASEAAIKKEMDLFKDREIIPAVYEKIMEAMPNARNTPEQAELYEAFEQGEVKKVMSIPREERKQIFVTGLSVYYASDVETGQFGESGFQRGVEGGEGGESGGSDMTAMRGMMSGRRSGVPAGDYSSGGGVARAVDAARTSQNRGFVIVLTGYSPYKEIGRLLDPAGAGGDPNKWGVVTRLMDMNSMRDVNCPFEVYKKTDKQHFEIRTGEVDLDAEMPPGIGVRRVSQTSVDEQKAELIDPMTKEVISKQTIAGEAGKKAKDRQVKTSDHWFVVNMKLRWIDRSAPAGGPMPGAVEEAPQVIQQEAPAEPPPAQPAPKRKGGGDKDIEM